MAKILVIDDDNVLLEQVEEWLKHEQHTVECVSDGREALDRLKLYQYDIAILDWGLPSMKGIDVLKEYRSRGGTIPIIMLTGQSEISHKEQGLDTGADDYLTKPFQLKELSARIRALLRRPQQFTGNKISYKNIEMDTLSHTVIKDGVELKLLPKEFALLQLFMQNPNKVFAPEALLDRIWKSESDSTVDTVYTYMKTLRKKISPESSSAVIATIPGVGYRLVAQDGDIC